MSASGKDEYRQRQAALAEAMAKQGLRGALVVSRGGATFDRFADVFYLAGHYQMYGYLPETPELFSGRSHCALVIDAGGNSILCISVDEYDEENVLADDVRCSEKFSQTVAVALADAGLGSGQVGLIGSDVLPLFYAREISERLPDLEWRDSDALLQRIRMVKSPSEQNIIRNAARIHSEALGRIRDVLEPGVSEAEAMSAFIEAVTAKGAGLYFAAVSSGPKIARWCSVGLPGYSTRPIKSGEMMRFDTGVILDGYLSDFGRTLVCGEANADQTRLIATVQTAVNRMIAGIRPGRLICEAVADGEAALADLGVTSEPAGAESIHSSFPVHWGHGLGMGWERPILTVRDTTPIVAGMYLAVERTLTMVDVGTAAAEQTLLVTDTGAQVISEGVDERWN